MKAILHLKFGPYHLTKPIKLKKSNWDNGNGEWQPEDLIAQSLATSRLIAWANERVVGTVTVINNTMDPLFSMGEEDESITVD